MAVIVWQAAYPVLAACILYEISGEYLWIFHISAGEFCDAAQEALLSLQRQAVIVFSQAMGNTTIARIETATAQIIYGV